MEDDLNGRRHQWKTTSIEDDLNGRLAQWKITSMEDDFNGRQPQWKTTFVKQKKFYSICFRTVILDTYLQVFPTLFVT